MDPIAYIDLTTYVRCDGASQDSTYQYTCKSYSTVSWSPAEEIELLSCCLCGESGSHEPEAADPLHHNPMMAIGVCYSSLRCLLVVL